MSDHTDCFLKKLQGFNSDQTLKSCRAASDWKVLKIKDDIVLWTACNRRWWSGLGMPASLKMAWLPSVGRASRQDKHLSSERKEATYEASSFLTHALTRVCITLHHTSTLFRLVTKLRSSHNNYKTDFPGTRGQKSPSHETNQPQHCSSNNIDLHEGEITISSTISVSKSGFRGCPTDSFLQLLWMKTIGAKWFFYRLDVLSPYQQRQCTEGNPGRENYIVYDRKQDQICKSTWMCWQHTVIIEWTSRIAGFSEKLLSQQPKTYNALSTTTQAQNHCNQEVTSTSEFSYWICTNLTGHSHCGRRVHSGSPGQLHPRMTELQ